MIISTLKQSGQSLYDNLPSGKPATETLPSSASVIVADGTEHPITASSTLLGHPSAHLVPSFQHNFIGVSPILNQGALGIIKQNDFFSG